MMRPPCAWCPLCGKAGSHPRWWWGFSQASPRTRWTGPCGAVAWIWSSCVEGESLDYCAQLEVPVIRVHHVGDGLPVEDAVAQLAREVLPFIERGHLANLDRKVGTQEGGTGQSFNWDISEGLAAQGLSFLMAGGLTPENVGRAVRKVRPWGVDVSSGVEIDGAKDAAKIKAFISAVRSAEG